MDAKDLEKIIWPTSVDMMGQVVVAMTFFFLLIFIVLAYFLKQIELRQRVTSNVQAFQHLYEPIKKFIAPTEIKKQQEIYPNIDEFILQIQDYLLSVPPSRVKKINSLIAKRNNLVAELFNLGYSGYSKDDPYSGDYSNMPIITTELLLPQGKWEVVLADNNDKLILRFSDNSLSPDRDTQSPLRQAVANFSNQTGKTIIIIDVYDSSQVVTENLSQRLSLKRAILIRNLIREGGQVRTAINIRNHPEDQRYPYGGIELTYE